MFCSTARIMALKLSHDEDGLFEISGGYQSKVAAGAKLPVELVVFTLK